MSGTECHARRFDVVSCRLQKSSTSWHRVPPRHGRDRPRAWPPARGGATARSSPGCRLQLLVPRKRPQRLLPVVRGPPRIRRRSVVTPISIRRRFALRRAEKSLKIQLVLNAFQNSLWLIRVLYNCAECCRCVLLLNVLQPCAVGAPRALTARAALPIWPRPRRVPVLPELRSRGVRPMHLRDPNG